MPQLTQEAVFCNPNHFGFSCADFQFNSIQFARKRLSTAVL